MLTMGVWWAAVTCLCLFRFTSGQSAFGSGLSSGPVLYIGFQQASYTFSESEQSSPQICVIVNGTTLGVTAVVEVTINGNSAQGGIDYVLNSTQLVISDLSTRECIDFNVIDDTLSEGSETVQAYLSLVSVSSNASNDTSVEFTVEQTNITIVDSRGLSEVPMSVATLLNAEVVTFTCISVGNFQIFGVRWLINGQPLNIEILPMGVSVTNNAEGSGVISSTLSLPATTTYDGAMVVCTAISEGTTFMSDPAVLTLQFATLSFEADSYTIMEAVGTLMPNIVVLDSNLPQATNVTVNVSTLSGSAISGSDFISVSEKIILTSDSLSPGSRTPFSVPIIDDTQVDPDESFSLHLSASSPGILINTSSALVTIIDDDGVRIEIGFQKTEYAVSESSGSLTAIVVAEGNFSSTFQLNISAANGTASSSTVYQLLQSVLTISPGTSEYQIDLAIIDNSVIELNGYVTISLRLSTSERLVVFTNRTTVITIYDNDFSDPVVRASSTATTLVDAEPASFICNVTTPLRNVDVIWFDGRGNVLNNSTFTQVGYNVTKSVVNGSIISILMVSSFSLSDYALGRFSCASLIDNPFDPRVTMANTPSVTGQLAAPSVNINIQSVSGSTENIIVGQDITVQCAIATNYGRPTDIDITPRVFWMVSYEIDGQLITDTFEATQLVNLTSAVFLSNLEYNPIILPRNFSCSSFVQIAPFNQIIVRSSEASVSMRSVNPQVPNLIVTVGPQSVFVVTNIPPYNTYAVTCSATIPRALVHLSTRFSIRDVSREMSSLLDTNYTPSQDCQRVSSSNRLCSFTVTITENSTDSEGLQRACSVEISSGQISVAHQERNFHVVINTPAPPAQVSDYHVYGVSNELAILHWFVPRITYTPEVYYIQYSVSDEEGTGEILVSPIVVGSTNLSAVNMEYEIVLDGLNRGTFYTATVVSNNSFGAQFSEDIPFTTPFLDIYRVVSEIDDVIPLGAPLTVDFRFNGEGTTTIFQSTPLTFYPLFHVPAINPSSIFYEPELQQVIVRYTHVSPSMTGQYVLCQEATRPRPDSRKRGVEPPSSTPRICGGRITLNVIVPTLTISTNLLIEQYVNGVFVGEDESPTVTCSPSDLRAPVRWRSMLGIYGELPDDYEASLSPRGFNRSLTFPTTYLTTPSRTETFICDLINVELSDEEEISPQMVTVRFIQAEVTILHDDEELSADAVINQFPIFGLASQLGLSLRCLSINGHANLQWLSRDVTSLIPDGPISSQSSPFINITYFPESDSQQRDVVLTVTPIMEPLTGYYSCQSQQSGLIASVFTTRLNPLWMLASPSENYLPVGSYLPVVSLQYADISNGYQNLGAGFSYSLTFHPNTPQRDEPMDQNGTRVGQSMQPSSGSQVTLINGQTSDLIGNNITYMIIGQLSRFDGRYQLNATHLSSGTNYSDTIELRVVVPHFVEVDELVYSRIGDLATLSCFPNDTMAMVYWMISGALDEEVLRTSNEDFSLSPPQRNHLLTFNATSVIVRNSPDIGSLQDQLVVVTCGFINGDNSSDLISPMNVTVQLQRERIRMVKSPQGFVIQNNTVINLFTDGPGSGVGESELDPNSLINVNLIVDCRASQGDHSPIWTTDSSAANSNDGSVSTDDGESRQIIDEYSARLQLSDITTQVEGGYMCQSQQSDLFTTFILSTENPYIRAVTSSQLVATEGDSVNLTFLVAVDSDGNTWNSKGATFSFTNRSRVEISLGSSFVDSNLEFPQYFIYTIPSVNLSHAGTYTAAAPRSVCDLGVEECDLVTATIELTVITYCPEHILGGVLWARTQSNSEVAIECRRAGSLFRQGTMITRSCSEYGIWSDFDLSTCTLVTNSLPFLLMSFIIEIDQSDVDALDTLEPLEVEMNNFLRSNGIIFVDVSINSAYFSSLSLTFEVTLPFSINQEETLDLFFNYFSTSFTTFGNYTVRGGNRDLIQVLPVDSCPCQRAQSDSMSIGTVGIEMSFELCSGVSISPCNCTSGSCQCSLPFVGDGIRCTVDSDGDGYPDVSLQSPICDHPEGMPEVYCIQDNCPMVINLDQDPFACEANATVANPTFAGCPYEVDSTWGITWPNTDRNSSNTQLCPGGHDTRGTATRYCNINGEWEEANVLECTTIAFIELEELAETAITTLNTEEQIMQTTELTELLIEATEPQNRSLLPNDLQVSTRILTTVLEVLEDNENATTNLVYILHDLLQLLTKKDVIDIFDNMLDISQMDGWRTLQMVGLTNGSEMLLNSAERYGLLVASSVNGSNGDQPPLRQSRQNIVVTGSRYSEPPSSDIKFPTADDTVNYTLGSNDFSKINIPPSLIKERMNEMADNQSLPVFFLLLRDIPMGAFIPNSSTIAATTCTAEGSMSTSAATDVLAAQVGMGSSRPGSSQTLQNNPVLLNFSFASVENSSLFRCVYWNFSQPLGNGSWAISGVTTTNTFTSGNVTSVQCFSSHLTSFAVLVDVASGLENLGDEERIALEVVSYIGCAISIICLISTVIFFLLQWKKLKTSVHYFVHLNLAITLLLAFIVFVVGVETAIGSTGGCAFVAALLHYLFLSAFCWMLCEGIMLYLLLILVFSEMSKKWWPFLIIGYVPPLPVVIITVAVRYQYYGVRDNCGDLLYCWLSVEKGTIFGFVGPMLAIILVNVVFLSMALYALFKTKKRQFQRKQQNDEVVRKTAKAIMTASIVLLPLLGLTWAFGILTVNVNTTAFAWLFTIFNSLQGAFIFFFHVVRSDQVWSKVSPRLQSLKRSTLRSTARWYEVSSSDTSTLSKGSTFRSNRSELGTLSRDPNSTLGRGDTYKRAPASFSDSTVQSTSFYELKSDLSPISETNETILENETKANLSVVSDKSPGVVVTECLGHKEDISTSPDLNDTVMSESDKEAIEGAITTSGQVHKETEIPTEVIVNPNATDASNGTPKEKRLSMNSDGTKVTQDDCNENNP